MIQIQNENAYDQCVEISKKFKRKKRNYHLQLSFLFLCFAAKWIYMHAKWRPHSVCNVHVIKLKCYVCLAATHIRSCWNTEACKIILRKTKNKKRPWQRVKMFIKNDKNAYTFRQWSAMVCSINFRLEYRLSSLYIYSNTLYAYILTEWNDS